MRQLPGRHDEALLALPFFEPHHVDLAHTVDRWCDAHIDLWSDCRADTDPDKIGRRVLKALGSDGRLEFLRPDASDGIAADGDLRSLCLAREALAYADDLADFTFSIQALAATPVLRHGTDEQRRRWLPDMATGDLAGCFAVSEEDAGSDLAAISLCAQRVDAGYRLDGRKAWIANGTIAGLYCVIARTGDGPGALGLTAFLVPATTPGVRVEPVTAIAARSFCHLVFDGCVIPENAVLGRVGGGFAIAMELLERFRMTVGAAAVGFARRALDTALARARSRKVSSGQLFDLPTVRATFADMEVQLNAAALLVGRAAWEADRGNRNFGRHSSIAKLYATEAAQEIVDAAVQLHGAAGLVAGSVPERLYRQIRSLRIYEGTSEVQKVIIANTIDAQRAEHIG